MGLPQEFIIGLIASAITQVLRILAEKFTYRPGAVVVNIVLFVGTVAFAFIQAKPDFPAVEDPMMLAQELLSRALVIFGSAQILYNALLKQVVYPKLRLDV